MRMPRDIERLAQDLRLSPTQDADRRILAAAEAALNQAVKDKSVVQRPLWRIIMESPVTKWAVAAVLIVGLLMIAHRFSGDEQREIIPKPEVVKERDTPIDQETLLAHEQQRAQAAFDRQDESALLALLEEGQDTTRIQVAGYLGQVGSLSALKQLQRLLDKESDSAVVEAITSAITRIRKRLMLQEANDLGTQVHSHETNEVTYHDAVHEKEGVLELCLVDRDTGEPVSGCDIQVRSGWPLGDVREVTDKDGKCQLDVSHDQLYSLTVSILKAGYCPLQVTYQIGRGNIEPWPKTHEIQLFKGIDVSGRVIDPNGHPMPDFLVGYSVAEPRIVARHSHGNVSFGWQYLTLETDKQGYWFSQEMLPGASNVSMSSRNSNYIFASGQQTRLDRLMAGEHVLTVWSGLTLTGLVQDELGYPLVDVEVKAWKWRGNYAGGMTEVTTDPNGIFVFKHVHPGDWVVAAFASGFAPDRQLVDVQKDQEPLVLTLGSGQTAAIQVLDQSGSPLEGANIYWTNWIIEERSGISPSRPSMQTDAQGWARVEDLPQGKHFFRVRKGGYVTNDNVLIETRERPYTVILYQSGMLKGTVVDAESGQSIPEFYLYKAEVDQHGDTPSWNTNPLYCVDGQYQVEMNAAGVMVRVEAPGYLPYCSPCVMNDGTELEHSIALVPGELRSLTGTVYLPDGMPAVGAEVIQVTEERSIRLQAGEVFAPLNTKTMTDPNGQFDLPGMQEPNELFITHPLGYYRIDPALVPSLTRIDLEPWACIEVLAPEGESCSRVHLDRTYMTSRDQWVVVDWDMEFDANGVAVFERVSAGAYAVARVEEVDGQRKSMPSQIISVEAGCTETLMLEGNGGEIVLQLLNDAITDHQEAVVVLRTHLDLRTITSIDVMLPENLLCMTAQEKQQWNETFMQSEEGQAYVRRIMPLMMDMKTYTGEVDADGQVLISGVQPGLYDLIIELDLQDRGMYRTVKSGVEITENTDDLGAIELHERLPVREGQIAPGFDLPSHSSKIVTLKDCRGKFVLVESGGPMKEMNYVHSVLPYLKQVHQQYDKDKLEILSLSLWTMSVIDLRPPFDYFIAYHEIPWKVLYVEIERINEMPELLDQYDKKFTLIDPEGHVVMTADTDQAEQLSDLVSQAMAEYEPSSDL